MSAATIRPPGPTMQPTPQKPTTKPATRESGGKRDGKLGPFVRIAISIVIVWHFASIFLAALCIPATSDLVVNIAQQPPMQWYLDALYLNQGHSFFAPDVGPSHILQYELFDQGGRSLGNHTMPSTDDQWPRLLYHRHFMLADQAPSEDPKWGRIYLEAYARQLLRENPQAQSVRVRHYAHWPLTRELEEKARDPNYGRERAYQDLVRQIAEQGITIDARGYQLLGDAQQRRSDLGEDPQPDHSSVWHSGPVETAGRWNGGGPR